MKEVPKIGQRVYNPDARVDLFGIVQSVSVTGKVRVKYEDGKVRSSWKSVLMRSRPRALKQIREQKKKHKDKIAAVMMGLDSTTRDRVLQHMTHLDLTCEQVLKELELV